MPVVPGVERFKYLKSYGYGNSVLEKYTREEAKKKLIIWSDQSRSFYVMSGISQLKKYLASIPSEDQHYFEVVFGDRRQRPHLDIDGGDARRFAEIMRAVREATGPGVKIVVTDSSRPGKFSRHIVVDKWVKNAKAAEEFMEEVVSQISDDNIDSRVFSAVQQWRLLGSRKDKPGAMPKRLVTRGAKLEDTLLGKYHG